MAQCPDGHDSAADDYCSVCGLAMASGTTPDQGKPATPEDPASPALASVEGGTRPNEGGSLACPNCSEPHGRDDVFCENCGYDFITGSLPQAEKPLTSGSAPSTVPGGAPAAVLAEVTVTVDTAFHEHMDAEGMLTLPDPAPPARIIAVTSSPVLVGRASPSRNIYPDLDLADDPAASGRHARLDRRPDGVWTITDLGSTNGTYVGDDFTQLEANTSHQLVDGVPVFVGAWTRLDLTSTA